MYLGFQSEAPTTIGIVSVPHDRYKIQISKLEKNQEEIVLKLIIA